jgi:hypothetical protein
MKHIIFSILLLFFVFGGMAQQKLPYNIIEKIVTQTDMFILNSSTQFAHVDLPVGKYQQFFGYIKDSIATPIVGANNPVYYKWYLKDGSEINGDVYFKDKQSYILFKIDNKTYINYFMPDGLLQLKNIFKF